MPKDICIVQLRKQPDYVDPETGVLRQNRYLSLRQMGISSKVVTGIHKLAQHVTKMLLTTQGSDLYDPDYGSGLLYILRDSKSLAELRDIKGKVAVHMLDIRQQVIRSQTNLSLPADERLRDLTLLRVDFAETQMKFEIDLRLLSEAGEARTIRLEEVVEEE